MFRFMKGVLVLVLLKNFLTSANPTMHTSGLDRATNVVHWQDMLDKTHVQGSHMVMMITEDKRMMLLQNGHEVYNKTLTHLQVPEISAIYGTAEMKTMNNTAYIGGFNGTVYELHVTVDEGKASVNMSTININLPCTTEVFASNGSNVVAACFGHNSSTLYIANIHSPAERSELKFTSVSDLSNILAVDNVFYFAQSGKLFSGDTNGQRVVEILQDCIQPWLIRHRDHFIIIHCQEKSIVFLPQEWSSVPGIWKGAWEDEKVYSCYGTGTAPLIFSSNRTMVTLYDIRNDFQKIVRFNGTSHVETITCAWSDNNLVLVYKEDRCDCWMKHMLDNKLEYKNSTSIPSANGMLDPLSTSRGGIDQSVLLFYSDVLQYLLLPSSVQTLLDLKTGFAYGHVTSNVVLYHGMILESSRDDSHTGKDEPNEESLEKSHSRTVPLVVGTILVVLVVSVVVLGFVYIWRRRHRNRINEEVPTEDTHTVRSSPTVETHTVRSSSTEDAERSSPTENTHTVKSSSKEDAEGLSPMENVENTQHTVRSSSTEDAERSRQTELKYTDNHKMIITQATETHLNSIV